MTTTDRPTSPPDPFGPSGVPAQTEVPPGDDGYGAWASQWGAEEPEGSLRSWISLAAIVGLLVLAGVTLGWAIPVIILAFVASVFLHELGHYLMARRAGMKVTEFFIGFGPRIWSFHRGETEYGVKAIPAGAYVRIIGMHNLEEVEEADEERTYRSKGYGKRLSVILAGPFMNILLGMVILAGVYLTAGVPNFDTWTVDTVLPGTTAASLGLEEGDRIVTVDGQAVGDDESMRQALAGRAGQEVEFVFTRDGETITQTATLGWRPATALAAVLPGIEDTDVILRIDGADVTTYDDMVAAFAAADGPASVEIQRGGGLYRLDVEPAGDLPEAGANGFIGVKRAFEPTWEGQPAGTAISTAVVETGAAGAAAVVGLVGLFSPDGLSDYAGEVGSAVTGEEQRQPDDVPQGLEYLGRAPGFEDTADNADRPVSIIGIVGLLGQSFERDGLPQALRMFALTNVLLGLFNLLPLLPFDGGHAVVATYEAIRSRKGRPYRVDMAKLMPLTYAVVVLLLMVFVTSAFLDVTRPVQLP